MQGHQHYIALPYLSVNDELKFKGVNLTQKEVDVVKLKNLISTD